MLFSCCKNVEKNNDTTSSENWRFLWKNLETSLIYTNAWYFKQILVILDNWPWRFPLLFQYDRLDRCLICKFFLFFKFQTNFTQIWKEASQVVHGHYSNERSKWVFSHVIWKDLIMPGGVLNKEKQIQVRLETPSHFTECYSHSHCLIRSLTFSQYPSLNYFS